MTFRIAYVAVVDADANDAECSRPLATSDPDAGELDADECERAGRGVVRAAGAVAVRLSDTGMR